MRLWTRLLTMLGLGREYRLQALAAERAVCCAAFEAAVRAGDTRKQAERYASLRAVTHAQLAAEAGR